MALVPLACEDGGPNFSICTKLWLNFLFCGQIYRLVIRVRSALSTHNLYFLPHTGTIMYIPTIIIQY